MLTLSPWAIPSLKYSGIVYRLVLFPAVPYSNVGGSVGAVSLRLWPIDWFSCHVVAPAFSPTGQCAQSPFCTLSLLYSDTCLCAPLRRDPNGLVATLEFSACTGTGPPCSHTQLVSKCVRDWRVSWRCWAVLPAGPGRGSAASCLPPSPKQHRRCQARGATDFGPHPRWGIQSWQESGQRLSRRFTTSLQLTSPQKRWGCDILPCAPLKPCSHYCSNEGVS